VAFSFDRIPFQIDNAKHGQDQILPARERYLRIGPRARSPLGQRTLLQRAQLFLAMQELDSFGFRSFRMGQSAGQRE
jgi:hypothetical protein